MNRLPQLQTRDKSQAYRVFAVLVWAWSIVTGLFCVGVMKFFHIAAMIMISSFFLQKAEGARVYGKMDGIEYRKGRE